MNFCERCNLTSCFLRVRVVKEPSEGLSDRWMKLFSRKAWVDGIISVKVVVVEVSVQGEGLRLRVFKEASH